MILLEELGRALDLTRPPEISSLTVDRSEVSPRFRVTLQIADLVWVGFIEVGEVEGAYESNLLELFAEAWWERS